MKNENGTLNQNNIRGYDACPAFGILNADFWRFRMVFAFGDILADISN